MRFLIRSGTVVSVVLALVLSTAGPSSATSGWKWANSTDYGAQGINIYGNGLQITDLVARYITPNADYLNNRDWRFVIDRYGCDPRGKSTSECPRNARWFSGTRHGNPPKGGTTCTTLNIGSALSIQNCQDYGMGVIYASSGGFSGYTVPRTSSAGTWFCTEIQLKTNSSVWQNNKPDGVGLRACAEILA